MTGPTGATGAAGAAGDGAAGAGGAGGAAGAVGLERHYRRLLVWYPAGHRREYGEEMVGVLMTSARDGQRRPNRGDALDLIGGGLRARFRRSRTGEGNPAWRDALAAFSVVAPVVVLGWLTAGYLVEVQRQNALPAPRHFAAIVEADKSTLIIMLIAAAIVVAALAVGPVLARRGQARAAYAVAAIVSVAALVSLVQMYRVFGAPDNELTLFLTLIAVMEVVALLASPGPGRGWQLLSRRGVILLAAVTVVAVAACVACASRYAYWNFANIIRDIAGAVSVLGVALTLRRPVGGRLMALWAIPGYQFLGFAAAQYLFTQLQFSSWVAFQVEFRFLPTIVIALLVVLAAWWNGRRNRHHTPGAAG